MNIAQAIAEHFRRLDPDQPPPQYRGFPRHRGAFERLRWMDTRPKPLWEDIEPLLSEPVHVPDAATTALTSEDVERLLIENVPGVDKAKIDQAKRDRGKP